MRRERGHQIGDEMRLVQQRHEDGVDGQVVVVVVGRRWPASSSLRRETKPAATKRSTDTPKKKKAPIRLSATTVATGAAAKASARASGEGEAGDELPAGDDAARRQVRVEGRQPVDGVDGEALGAGADERGADRRRRGNAQALPGGRVARQPMGDLGQRLFLGRDEGGAGGARRLGEGAARGSPPCRRRRRRRA